MPITNQQREDCSIALPPPPSSIMIGRTAALISHAAEVRTDGDELFRAVQDYIYAQRITEV